MEEGIFTALAKAQKAFGTPKASKTAQAGTRKYQYAPLDEVLKAVREPLNEQGLFLTQRTAIDEQNRFYVSTLVCSGSDSVELDRCYYEYDRNPQEFGKRETYARRYSLNKAFGLAGEEDTDGDVQQAKQPRKQPPKQQAPSRRKQMLAKIAQLKMECIQNGVKEEGIRAYEAATFGIDDTEALPDPALEQLGKYLKQLVEDSKHEHQQGND